MSSPVDLQAFRQGQQAARDGLDHGACPHGMHTRQRRSWMAGWRQEQAELNKSRRAVERAEKYTDQHSGGVPSTAQAGDALPVNPLAPSPAAPDTGSDQDDGQPVKSPDGSDEAVRGSALHERSPPPTDPAAAPTAVGSFSRNDTDEADMAKKLNDETGQGATAGHNAQARSQCINEAYAKLADIDRQIAAAKEQYIKPLQDKAKKVRKRVTGDTGYNWADLKLQYQIFKRDREVQEFEDENERGKAEDAMRESYYATAIGGQVDWITAAIDDVIAHRQGDNGSQAGGSQQDTDISAAAE